MFESRMKGNKNKEKGEKNNDDDDDGRRRRGGECVWNNNEIPESTEKSYNNYIYYC